VRVLKYSIPTYIQFNVKKMRDIHWTALLHRLRFQPALNASCNPKRVAVVSKHQEKPVGTTFDMEEEFLEPKDLTLPGSFPTDDGFFVVLENWGNTTHICVPFFEVLGRWYYDK
jgi:hypothetical protein